MEGKFVVENDVLNKENEKVKRVLNLSQELVMLNFLYEQKLITNEEMQSIKKEILRNYGKTNFI
jgi:hypothetical protein